MHGQPHNTIGNRIGIGSDRSGRCESRSPSLCVMRCRRYPLHQYSFPSLSQSWITRLRGSKRAEGWLAGGLVGWMGSGWKGRRAGSWLEGGLELEGLGLEGWKKVAKARTCSVPFHQRGLEGRTAGGLEGWRAGGWRAGAGVGGLEGRLEGSQSGGLAGGLGWRAGGLEGAGAGWRAEGWRPGGLEGWRLEGWRGLLAGGWRLGGWRFGGLEGWRAAVSLEGWQAWRAGWRAAGAGGGLEGCSLEGGLAGPPGWRAGGWKANGAVAKALS